MSRARDRSQFRYTKELKTPPEYASELIDLYGGGWLTNNYSKPAFVRFAEAIQSDTLLAVSKIVSNPTEKAKILSMISPFARKDSGVYQFTAACHEKEI